MGLPKNSSLVRIPVCLLIIICLVVSTSAQQPELNFVNFSSKSGLSSNSINAILKDHQGYMWFGTDNGLNKFDGTNFIVYTSRLGDSNSIGGNEIISLVEDKKGNLWVGTDQSLSYYDREQDRFINHFFVKNSAARAMVVDAAGDIWVGSYYGLYKFRPGKGVISHFTSKPAPGHLQSNTVLSLFIDQSERLWVGTTKGVHLYTPGNQGFDLYQHNINDPSSIADDLVRSITQDPEGNMWFATNQGLSRLKSGSGKFDNFLKAGSPGGIVCDPVYSVVVDKAGSLWLGTEHGLSIMDLNTEQFRRLKADPRNRYSLKVKSVRSIFIDEDGIYWLGGYNSGVNKYDKNLAFFENAESNAFDITGLSAPLVTCFSEDPDGRIYIGTDGGGLNLFDPVTKSYSHPALGLNGKGKSVLALERVGDQLLVGTYRDGMYVMDITNRKVTRHYPGTGADDLTGKEVFCLKKDSKGRVWIGTNGNGINIYDHKNGQIRNFKDLSVATGEKLVVNGYIRGFEEDKAGNMWIATQGGGIAVFDSTGTKLRVLNQLNSGLHSNNVVHIFADRDDNIWVSALGGGLSKYNRSTNTFSSVSARFGYANTLVYKILQDASGKLWMSTNSGISCFDPKSKQFKNYSVQHGIQRSTFYRGSGILTSAGKIYFGGLEGFNHFDPGQLQNNRNIPALVFTDLKISHTSVTPGENSPIRHHISMADEIKLDYKQNFSLDFIALNYTAPSENRYAYKLEGFDRDWNNYSPSHTAVYTNLDPGEYIFKVKARSDDGLWSSPEKSIKIYVEPPFWLTIYAYIFYVLAALVLLAVIRYRGIQRLKNKFKQEQERLQFSQMLEQEKRERERQHEFDELKIKFLTNLSHEFRTPISLIAGPVDKLVSIEQNPEKLEQLGLMRRNAQRLLNLVNQLLDFRKLEQKELNLSLAESDIILCIRDVADSFRDMWEYKHIRFSFSTSVYQYFTLFDRDKIERILFNLLSNAVKFTPKDGQISLEVENLNQEGLKIMVKDTGVGMSAEEKSKIFDRFFQGDMGVDILNQGSGIGLSITREFVRMHNGTIEVASEPKRGTTFTMIFPFKATEIAFEHPVPAADRTEPEMGQDLGTLPAETPGPEKLTILLVEDNDEFRNYLKTNLQSGYKIIEATNGKEGWQKALAAHPKIIVSDVSMPVMDGITLSRKLQSDKRTKHIPIILLTALTGDANQISCLATGASDYLAKPFNFDILRIKIKNLLTLNQNLEKTYSKQLKVDTPVQKVQSHDELLLIKISQYIESNIDNPDLSVEELSKHVFMSRRSLYSKIISLTGETPVEFIRSVKLNKAIYLLENSDMKMSEVAYTSGFATPNYFTRAFKAKFNVSPTEYVNLKRNTQQTQESDNG